MQMAYSTVESAHDDASLGALALGSKDNTSPGKSRHKFMADERQDQQKTGAPKTGDSYKRRVLATVVFGAFVSMGGAITAVAGWLLILPAIILGLFLRWKGKQLEDKGHETRNHEEQRQGARERAAAAVHS